MSVENVEHYAGPYLTNGLTVAFPFSFKALSAAEVAVVLRSSGGVESVLSEAAFSVTLLDQGGTVTLSTPPVAGSRLFVVSAPDFRQAIQFENGSRWIAEPVNEVNDRHAARSLYLKGQVDRSLRVPIEEEGPDIAPIAERAGKLFGFDLAGRMLSVTYGTLASILAPLIAPILRPFFKGDPGSSLFVGLFTELNGMGIPFGTNRVRTSGYSRSGRGAADYGFDAEEAVPLIRGPNIVDFPDDLTTSGWIGAAGPATAIYNSVDTIITDSTDSYARWERTFPTVSPYMTVQALIRKDLVPASDRKVILRLRFTGGTKAVQYDELIDTMEGTAYPGNRASSATSAALDYGIRDATDLGFPDYWLAWVTGPAAPGSTATTIRIYAANGSNNSSSTATTGSVSIRALDLYSGTSAYYIPADSPLTTFVAGDGRVFKLALDQEITPFQFGCMGDAITDDTIALKAASDFASNTKCVAFNWGGSFATSSDFTWGRTSGQSATRVFRGEFRIVPLVPATIALTLLNLGESQIDAITIDAGGGQNYNSRSTYVGVRLKGDGRGLKINRINGNNLLHSTLMAEAATGDNYNFARIGTVKGFNIGSGSATQSQSGSLLSNWQWVSDPVNNEGFTQRTRLRVDTPFPPVLLSIMTLSAHPIQLRISGYTYTVKSANFTDPANVTIDVFPRLPAASRVAGASGSAARWIFGAVFHANGGNAQIDIGVLDANTSGRGAVLGALHAGVIEHPNFSFNGQGVLLGPTTSSSNLSNVIGRCYFENQTNPEEIVIMSPGSFLEVQDAGQGDPPRWVDLSVSRANDDSLLIQSGSENAYKGVSVSKAGRRFEWQGRGLAYGRPTSITVGAAFNFSRPYYGNTFTVILSAADAALSGNFGYAGGTLYRTGTGTNGFPTGNTIFTPPAGGTINGSTSALALAGGAFLVSTADPANLAWLVRAL